MVSNKCSARERKRQEEVRAKYRNKKKKHTGEKKAYKTVNKFWCTDSFNCSIVCIHGKIQFSNALPERKRQRRLRWRHQQQRRFECHKYVCSLSLSPSVYLVHSSSCCCFYSIEKSAIVYKSDLLVAIDKLKQCTPCLSLIRLPLLALFVPSSLVSFYAKICWFFFFFSFVHSHICSSSLLCIALYCLTFGINQQNLFQTKQHKTNSSMPSTRSNSKSNEKNR